MKETEPEGAHRLYRRPAGPTSIGSTGNGSPGIPGSWSI